MTRWRLLMIATVVGVAVVLAIVLLREQSGSDARSSAVAPAVPRTASTDAAVGGPGVTTATTPGAATTPPAPPAANPRGVGFELPGSLAKVPDRYELSMVGGRAFVNLAGGPSKLYPGGLVSAMPRTRTLQGRVIDAHEQPVAGAVVIIASRIDVTAGHVAGVAGATTDGRGEFSLNEAPDEPGMLAFAVHPNGWSLPVAIDTARVILRLQGRGALRGRATYNGHGESFNVWLKTRPESKLEIRYQTDPDGRYSIASLPPGDYTVQFGLAQNIAGGSSKAIEREVTIVDGKTAELDINQARKTVVVVSAQLPDGMKPQIVEYWLFSGTKAPVDIASARTREKAERAPAILFGGVDATTPNQFHDVDPGSHVVCVAIDRTALFGCTSVVVLDGDPAQEVTVKVSPASP